MGTRTVSAMIGEAPIGGLRRSAKWRYAVADGRFAMKQDGTGFTVDVDLGWAKRPAA